MKTGKALHIILIVLITIFLTGHLLLNNKRIQQKAASHVTRIAQTALGTDVTANRVQFIYPFGIVIDDLTVYDLNDDTLAHAASVSLHLKPLKLLRKKVSINSIRVNSPTIRLHADSIGAQPNYAFLTSLFKSDNESSMTFRANSVLVRNASLNYDIDSVAHTDSIFNPHHIGVSGLTANLSLKSISKDSIAFIVRKLCFAEQSGFRLTKAKGAVTVGNGFTSVKDLRLSTPNSNFEIDEMTAMTGLNDSVQGIPDFTALLRASVTGSDFKAFVPQASAMTDRIDLTIDCSSSNRELSIHSFTVNDAQSILSMSGSGTVLTATKPLVNGCRNSQLSGTFSGDLPQWIINQFGPFGISVPSQLYALGDGTFKLAVNNESDRIDARLDISSQAGNVNANLSGADNLYHANVDGSDIRLDAITGNKDLGKCSLTANADLTRSDDGYSCHFNGNIGSLQYRLYDYRNIAVNGQLAPGMIVSDIRFADRNGQINVDADIRTSDNPSYNVNIDANRLNLAAYNLAGKDSMALSATFQASLAGSDIDHISGNMSLDSLAYADAKGEWKMDSLNITIGETDQNQRIISIMGDFIEASVTGDYYISSIPYSLSRACGDVLPTIGKMVAEKLHAGVSNRANNFIIEAKIENADFMDQVFHKPVYLTNPADLSFSLNDIDSIYTAFISIPALDISGESLSACILELNSQEGTCRTQLSGSYGTSQNDKGVIDIKASFLAFEDIVRGTYSWTNTQGDITGKAKTLSQFFRYSKKQGLKSMTLIDSTDVIVKGTPWHFAIADIRTDMGKVSVSGFKVRNVNQYLFMDGVISADSTDVLQLSLHNIDLDRILTMMHANSIDLGGIASGDLSFAGITGRPSFYGSIVIEDFRFLDSYHGRLTANCHWDADAERVVLSGNMIHEGISNTLLSGYYVPKDKIIDIDIGAGNTDLYFLNHWTGSIFEELSGRATGNLKLFGQLPKLDLEGEAIVDNGRFVQSAVNTTFIVRHDTLRFKPGHMLFTDVEFYDQYGHDGILNCIIDHNHFSDWKVNMTADVANMLVYRQPSTEKGNFNATVYAEGSMNLTFNQLKGLDIKVNARTAPGTKLGISPNSGTVADYYFLTIVDGNTVKIDEETIKEIIIPDKKKTSKNNYNLDLDIVCSEDATIDLSLKNSLTGFLRGNGNVSVKFNPKDGPVLNGIYNLSYGQCTLSLEDVIRKNFTLMEGSYVRFNGAPSETELYLKTYHNVNSVSIYDLDPSITSSSNVRVRCLMNITGNASDPQLSFDIDMPNGTSDEKAILASATATEEQRNIQFMYLLAIGRFYTYDVNSGMNDGLTPSAMESIVNSTVSGQINNLLSQVLDNEKVSISSNVSASSYLSNDATNLNNKELEGILEAHLLNNRLLVNGNFGYRENTINNTSNFIGDFEVKYLLLPRQGISIKGYNKTNDKYFTKTTLTTQGVGLVFERDF